MIGVDEVGRGCLAGPLLVVAARQLSDLPKGLKDSKQLKLAERSTFYELLVKTCDFGEGWVKAIEIDRLGLPAALRLGAKRALRSLDQPTQENIVIDGKVNYLPKKYTKCQAIVRADQKIEIVMAASIYAKVSRDRYMQKLAKVHKHYDFANNVGYGTLAHFKALEKFGALKHIHRFSFAPLKIQAI